MFPGWMLQQPGMQINPPRPIAGSGSMDIDGMEPSDDGEWVPHPEHRIVQHVHRSNRKCNNLIGHIITAKRKNDPSLKSALKEIEDNIIQPYKESAQRAKAKVTSLEAKLDSTKVEYETRLTNMDNSFNVKYGLLQQKYQDVVDDKAKLIVEITSLKEAADRTRREFSPSFRGRGRGSPYRRDGCNAPYPRAITGGDFNTPIQPSSRFQEIPIFDSRLINWGNFQMSFPNKETAFTTLQHSGYRPGMDWSLLTIDWNQVDGLGHTSSYVDQCMATNTTPTPTAFPDAPRIGLQSIPLTSEDVKALASAASIEGNLTELYHLRFALSVAQYIEQTRDIAPHINPFYGAEKDILSMVREANPLWLHSTKFLDTTEFRITSVPTSWSEECIIPPVALPNNDVDHNNYFKWGHYWIVHGDPGSFIGQTITDTGYFDAESVRAGRILSETAPSRVGKDREALDAYRLSFVSLVSKAGLYEELIKKYDLTVASAFRLAHVREAPPYPLHYIARMLASYSLSIAVVNSMLRFGWQFCIDTQSVTSIPSSVKAEYANVLNEARFRAMFFPISPPGPNAIQKVPGHWPKMEKIIDFRRRRAQLALLRDEGIVPPTYKIRKSVIRPNNSDDLGLGSLRVNSEESNESSSSTGGNIVELSNKDTPMTNGTSSGD
ncbi:hypothetical protein PM082_014250 [Marasmius tenuissimus]|nr:hypothetical protein PM082_014250 [Marasmius tenuissimus]